MTQYDHGSVHITGGIRQNPTELMTLAVLKIDFSIHFIIRDMPKTMNLNKQSGKLKKPSGGERA
jgi:hypothetical protein